MSEFPSLTGATAHLLIFAGPGHNPNCLLQLQEHGEVPLYKLLGGYVDVAKKESLEDTIRRETNEEAPGLANLLDLSNARLHKGTWFTLMNYRKERRESCTFIIIWITEAERASIEEYAHTQNSATLLKASNGETSGLVFRSLLDVLEETFSAAVNRRKLVFPYGFLERLPFLDIHRLAAIRQMIAAREAEKEK